MFNCLTSKMYGNSALSCGTFKFETKRKIINNFVKIKFQLMKLLYRSLNLQSVSEEHLVANITFLIWPKTNSVRIKCRQNSWSLFIYSTKKYQFISVRSVMLFCTYQYTSLTRKEWMVKCYQINRCLRLKLIVICLRLKLLVICY